MSAFDQVPAQKFLRLTKLVLRFCSVTWPKLNTKYTLEIRKLFNFLSGPSWVFGVKNQLIFIGIIVPSP